MLNMYIYIYCITYVIITEFKEKTLLKRQIFFRRLNKVNK